MWTLFKAIGTKKTLKNFFKKMSVKNAIVLIKAQKRPKKCQILKKQLAGGYLFH
jgi:hypothetical protein